MNATIIEMLDAQPPPQEWTAAYLNLVKQIKTWIEAAGWALSQASWMNPQSSQPLDLDIFYENDGPVAIDTPFGRLNMIAVSPGVVELYSLSTLYRVRLINSALNNPWVAENLKDGFSETWRVRTDSGIYLREEWNSENFISLAKDLLTADS